MGPFLGHDRQADGQAGEGGFLAIMAQDQGESLLAGVEPGGDAEVQPGLDGAAGRHRPDDEFVLPQGRSDVGLDHSKDPTGRDVGRVGDGETQVGIGAGLDLGRSGEGHLEAVDGRFRAPGDGLGLLGQGFGQRGGLAGLPLPQGGGQAIKEETAALAGFDSGLAGRGEVGLAGGGGHQVENQHRLLVRRETT